MRCISFLDINPLESYSIYKIPAMIFMFDIFEILLHFTGGLFEYYFLKKKSVLKSYKLMSFLTFSAKRPVFSYLEYLFDRFELRVDFAFKLCEIKIHIIWYAFHFLVLIRWILIRGTSFQYILLILRFLNLMLMLSFYLWSFFTQHSQSHFTGFLQISLLAIENSTSSTHDTLWIIPFF